MCLFAEPIDAGRAGERGLIWEVVDDDQLAPRAAELAMRLAQGPTPAHRLAKRALREGQSHDLQGQLALEARLQGKVGRSRDFLEGVAAFLEKRKPAFEGR